MSERLCIRKLQNSIDKLRFSWHIRKPYGLFTKLEEIITALDSSNFTLKIDTSDFNVDIKSFSFRNNDLIDVYITECVLACEEMNIYKNSFVDALHDYFMTLKCWYRKSISEKPISNNDYQYAPVAKTTVANNTKYEEFDICEDDLCLDNLYS